MNNELDQRPIFHTSGSYKMNSEMGGSFSLKFVGCYETENGFEYHFFITNPDWERKVIFNDNTIFKVTNA